MKRLAVLLLLCGCSRPHYREKWFYRADNKWCGSIRYDVASDTWHAQTRFGPAVSPTEKHADDLVRRLCGGVVKTEDIQ